MLAISNHRLGVSGMAETRGSGIGLFATELIPKGTRVIEYVPGVDPAWTAEEVLAMNPIAQKFMYELLYYSPYLDRYILDVDDAHFTQHSLTPNLEGVEGALYAAVDILPGEEITVDYTKLCILEDKLFDKLRIKLGIKDEFMDSILEANGICPPIIL
jgi:SET domain-containing protein